MELQKHHTYALIGIGLAVFTATIGMVFSKSDTELKAEQAAKIATLDIYRQEQVKDSNEVIKKQTLCIEQVNGEMGTETEITQCISRTLPLNTETGATLSGSMDSEKPQA